MKLNLLPTYVSKEKQAKTGVILGLLIGVVGVAAAVGLIFISRSERDRSYTEMTELEPQHAQVVALAKSADTIIEKARPIILNINLAQAMNAHNTVYPDLYDEVRRYIPSFFRVTSMAATPSSAEVATVTLTGVLQTQQQYADLMLALLRIPGATSVTREGYQIVSPQVPPLTETDQNGRPLRPGEAPIPTDPQERLDYFIAQGTLSGFEAVGGFGTEPGRRGAMPLWSEITVSVVIPRAIMTPNPRATLSSGGGGGGGNRPNNPAPSTGGDPRAAD